MRAKLAELNVENRDINKQLYEFKKEIRKAKRRLRAALEVRQLCAREGFCMHANIAIGSRCQTFAFSRLAFFCPIIPTPTLMQA